MILILGEREDPHIGRVRAHLRRLGVPSTRVDPVETVTLPGFHLEGSGQPARYAAIWDRMKPFTMGTLGEDEQFIVRERVAAVRALQMVHPPHTQMNHPIANEMGRSKAYQLQIARLCGLRVPATYIGNNRRRAEAFVRRCRSGAVMKHLTWYADRSGRFSFTNDATAGTLAEHPAEVAYSPLIYQERIAKKYELRVTSAMPPLL